jgi:hypothetical protein
MTIRINISTLKGFSQSIVLPKDTATSDSPLSYAVQNIRFSTKESQCSGFGLVHEKLETLEDLNKRVRGYDFEYMVYIPKELLPDKELLGVMKKCGIFPAFTRNIDSLAFCSSIRIFNKKTGISSDDMSLIFYKRIRINGQILDPRTTYINTYNGTRIFDAATLIQLISHETTHLANQREKGITDNVLSEILAYNSEKNAMLRMLELETEEKAKERIRMVATDSHSTLIDGLKGIGIKVDPEISESVLDPFEIEVETDSPA